MRYDAKKDAEQIIENIFKRQRWTPDLRDDLSERLERIVSREAPKKAQVRCKVKRKR